jgi:hypothetical protein
VSATGIAGAIDYQPATDHQAVACAVCGKPIDEAPVSVRVLPGRLGQACSAACVASPMWRGRLVLVPEWEGEWI